MSQAPCIFPTLSIEQISKSGFAEYKVRAFNRVLAEIRWYTQRDKWRKISEEVIYKDVGKVMVHQ